MAHQYEEQQRYRGSDAFGQRDASGHVSMDRARHKLRHHGDGDHPADGGGQPRYGSGPSIEEQSWQRPREYDRGPSDQAPELWDDQGFRQQGGWGPSRSSGLQRRAREQRLGSQIPFDGHMQEEVRTRGENGPHVGKGPRGYRRSDERILEDVGERLERSGDVDASQVEISCENGIVTLRGEIEDRSSKRFAEDLAHDVYGVKDVMNNLSITSGVAESLLGSFDVGREDDDPSA